VQVGDDPDLARLAGGFRWSAALLIGAVWLFLLGGAWWWWRTVRPDVEPGAAS